MVREPITGTGGGGEDAREMHPGYDAWRPEYTEALGSTRGGGGRRSYTETAKGGCCRAAVESYDEEGELRGPSGGDGYWGCMDEEAIGGETENKT